MHTVMRAKNPVVATVLPHCVFRPEADKYQNLLKVSSTCVLILVLIHGPEEVTFRGGFLSQMVGFTPDRNVGERGCRLGGGEGQQHKGCEAVGVAGCIQLSIKNLTSEINRVITVSFTFIVNQELTEYFDI
jgi:hypothetical protein